MSHASDTAKLGDGSLGRHGSLREESRTRDPVDRHRRRIQLHDLMDILGRRLPPRPLPTPTWGKLWALSQVLHARSARSQRVVT